MALSVNLDNSFSLVDNHLSLTEATGSLITFKVKEIIQTLSETNNSLTMTHRFVKIENNALCRVNEDEASTEKDLSEFIYRVSGTLSDDSEEFAELQQEYNIYKYTNLYSKNDHSIDCKVPVYDLATGDDERASVNLDFLTETEETVCTDDDLLDKLRDFVKDFEAIKNPFHEILDHPTLTEDMITNSFGSIAYAILVASYFQNGVKDWSEEANKRKFHLKIAFNYCLSRITDKIEDGSLSFDYAYQAFINDFLDVLNEYTKLHPASTETENEVADYLEIEQEIYRPNGVEPVVVTDKKTKKKVEKYYFHGKYEHVKIKRFLSSGALIFFDAENVLTDVLFHKNFKDLLNHFFKQILTSKEEEFELVDSIPRVDSVDDFKKNILTEKTKKPKKVRFNI